MKKLIIIGLVSIWITDGAHAVSPQVNCCQCDWAVGVTPKFAPQCTDKTFCNGCLGTISSTIVSGVCTPSCHGGSVGPVDPVDPINPTFCKQNQYMDFLKQCSNCPDGGTTDNLNGGTDITDCYLPKGTIRSDATGTYTYTDNCNYTGFVIG